jgi:hypothetical protein
MAKRTFAPFLCTFVGLDQEARIGYMTHATIASWGQTTDTTLARAIEHLQAHVDAATRETPDVELYDASAPYALWHVVRNDSYESYRLTLPGFLASFRGKVAGNPIAIAPHRSLLVVSGDGHPEAIARLARMAENEFNASPRSISPALYGLNAEGEVAPYTLPADHPHFNLVQRGHYLLAASTYNEQKTCLDEKFANDGVDVFVASLMLMTDKTTGKISSLVSMAKNVEALLPVADRVALQTDPVALVPWAKLLELAPECFAQAPEFDPPRLRTVGWPSPTTLAALEQSK